MVKKTILLAAGGTGGHLFPAFALTQELKRRGAEVHIVTDERVDHFSGETPADEMHIVPSATIKGRNFKALFMTFWTLLKGVFVARKLIKKVSPNFVLGFGGYPTFPPLIAASMASVRTGLHDQNAVMGRANRLLARRVDVIATSFEDVKYLPDNCKKKVVLTGNPVRDEVLKVADVKYPALLEDGAFSILIFGGSQGARFFSDFFPEALAMMPANLKSRLRIIQQCREEDLDRVRAIYDSAGITAQCASFFSDLPELMSQAHLIISRSGASTVAELAVCGRPAIMVPLPHALDNDQLLNAKRLADVQGGWIMEQNNITKEEFQTQLELLMNSASDLQKTANAAKSIGQPDAVERLADMVLSQAAD